MKIFTFGHDVDATAKPAAPRGINPINVLMATTVVVGGPLVYALIAAQERSQKRVDDIRTKLRARAMMRRDQLRK